MVILNPFCKKLFWVYNWIMFTDFKLKLFFKRHNFVSKMIVDEILTDMRRPKSENRGMDMSRTWMLPPSKNPENEKVIVIDAGGTNFRSCLVSFDGSGNAEISDFKKTFMPATEKEYSKDEFFSAIADRIEYLKGKAEKIGFCFSYSLDMTPEHDAIPNAFSKEFKARSVLGCPVGKCLKDELEKRGWKVSKISVINDTVGALLAGKVKEKDAGSYIGFILGTGMNAAFVAPEGNIWDEKGQNQIIVCESGKCNSFKLSDFDIDADKRTAIPVQFPLEKCCSGAYLGNTCLSFLKFAANENLFSEKAAENFKKLALLSTIDADNFLNGFDKNLQDKNENPVEKCCFTEKDRKIAFKLLDSAVDRCAHYAASILAANLIATEKGKSEGNSPAKEVCIVCNGTTFYKTHRLKERTEKYLFDYAYKKCGISYKTVCVENDITLGTAVAALI